MRALRVLTVFTIFGWATVGAAPVPKGEKAVMIDGLADGKKVQPDLKAIGPGAEAAAKLIAASNLTDNLNPGQPIAEDMWKQQVTAGIENKRPHLRIRFGTPRQIDGKLNGVKAKLGVSEVVFFEPAAGGPDCLWARDGDRYYFANQLAGHGDLVEWLGKAQKR